MIIVGFNFMNQILAKHWLFKFILFYCCYWGKKIFIFFLNITVSVPKSTTKSCGLSDFNPYIYSFLSLFVIKMMRKGLLYTGCISNGTTVKLPKKLKAQYLYIKYILEFIWKRFAFFLEIS